MYRRLTLGIHVRDLVSVFELVSFARLRFGPEGGGQCVLVRTSCRRDGTADVPTILLANPQPRNFQFLIVKQISSLRNIISERAAHFHLLRACSLFAFPAPSPCLQIPNFYLISLKERGRRLLRTFRLAVGG